MSPAEGLTWLQSRCQPRVPLGSWGPRSRSHGCQLSAGALPIALTVCLSHRLLPEPPNHIAAAVSRLGEKLYFSLLTGSLFFIIKYFIYLFLGRGREGEKEGEKHWCVRESLIGCLSYMPPPGDLAHNSGICPDRESNR